MRSGTRRRATTLLALSSLVIVTGCSTKSTGGSSSSDSGKGGVKTGRGISGDTIKLGSLTDLTGVFAALGKDITNAQSLYWKEHKVCGKYTVKPTVKDHGYDTEFSVGVTAASVVTRHIVVASCGGGSSYKNSARPPAPLNITASVSSRSTP